MAYIGKSPGTGVRNRFIYTATAGQTTFSGSDDHSRTLSYTDAEFTDVFLNGVKLDKSDYTATSGTSIVLGSAASVDDILEVLAFDTFSVFSGDFSQDVTVGADLTVDTDTLHVDSANNRVGIGTTSPDRLLTLQGDNSYMWIKDAGGGNTAFIGSDGSNDGWLRLYDSSHTAKVEIESDGVTYFNGGNVGIGESSPSNPLEVIGNVRIKSASGDSQGLNISSDVNGDAFINAGYSVSDLKFGINGTERMRIDQSGNLLVGKTSVTNSGSGHVLRGSDSALFSRGSSTAASETIQITRYNNDGLLMRLNTGTSGNAIMRAGIGVLSGGGMYFTSGNGNNERVRISNSGAVSISKSSGNGYLSVQQAYDGTTSSAVNMHILSNGNFLRSTSSGRYKTDIEDAEMSYAEELYNLRPIYFRSLCTVDNPNHSHWGFVAEEVAEIDSRLCFYKTKEVVLDDEGNQTFDDDGALVERDLDEPIVEGVQYDRMIPLLLMLLKAEKDKVETLQTKVATLETQNADFETRIAALEAV